MHNKRYKTQTYLELDERSDFDSEGIDSVIGYYKLIVPRLNQPFTNLVDPVFRTPDYEIIKAVRKVLSTSIIDVDIEDDYVEFYCYKGSGDYVTSISDIYALTNEIEEKVKLAMDLTKIQEYTLVVQITTMYC